MCSDSSLEAIELVLNVITSMSPTNADLLKVEAIQISMLHK